MAGIRAKHKFTEEELLFPDTKEGYARAAALGENWETILDQSFNIVDGQEVFVPWSQRPRKKTEEQHDIDAVMGQLTQKHREELDQLANTIHLNPEQYRIRGTGGISNLDTNKISREIQQIVGLTAPNALIVFNQVIQPILRNFPGADPGIAAELGEQPEEDQLSDAPDAPDVPGDFTGSGGEGEFDPEGEIPGVDPVIPTGPVSPTGMDQPEGFAEFAKELNDDQFIALGDLTNEIATGRYGAPHQRQPGSDIQSRILQRIMDITGYGLERAQSLYWQQINNNVGDMALTPGGDVPPVLTPEEKEGQFQNLFQQYEQDRPGYLRRLALEKYPTLGRGFFGENVLPRLQSRFEQFSPIMGFGTLEGPLTPGSDPSYLTEEQGLRNMGILRRRFEDFITGAPPSPQQLGGRLAEIMRDAATYAPDSAEYDVFRNQFWSVPTGSAPLTQAEAASKAFQASILPTLQGVAPHLRGGLQNILTSRYRDELARDPGKYSGPLDVFREYQRRGFIPQ